MHVTWSSYTLQKEWKTLGRSPGFSGGTATPHMKCDIIPERCWSETRRNVRLATKIPCCTCTVHAGGGLPHVISACHPYLHPSPSSQLCQIKLLSSVALRSWCIATLHISRSWPQPCLLHFAKSNLKHFSITQAKNRSTVRDCKTHSCNCHMDDTANTRQQATTIEKQSHTYNPKLTQHTCHKIAT